MTENPNLKKAVLDYVIKESAAGRMANLRDLADEMGVDVHRLANKEPDLSPAVNCGTTPVCPWVWKKDAAREHYEKWDAEPPAEFEAASWVDD